MNQKARAAAMIVFVISLMMISGVTDIQAENTNVQSGIIRDSISNAPEVCRVTYIANDGFFIETANHKILIDAIFGNINGNWCDQPGDSALADMINGTAPFDNADLLLITHKHADHFNEPMAINFMKNNSKAVLICPDQVNEMLMHNPDYPKVADRICSLISPDYYDSSFDINNINIRALRFDHSKYFVTDSVSGETYNLHDDIENLGYLISADGFSIFHSGDDSPSNELQYENYGLANNQMDLAFLDRVFLGPGGMDLLNKYINARNIVFMHVEPGRRENYRSAIKDFPLLHVFAGQMEKVEYRKER